MAKKVKNVEENGDKVEEKGEEEEEWEAASAESRLSFPVRGGGEDGGAVGPWWRSGTEVLHDLSDLVKG